MPFDPMDDDDERLTLESKTESRIQPNLPVDIRNTLLVRPWAERTNFKESGVQNFPDSRISCLQCSPTPSLLVFCDPAGPKTSVAGRIPHVCMYARTRA